MIDSRELLALNLAHLCCGEPIIKGPVLLIPDDMILVSCGMVNALNFILEYRDILAQKYIKRWPIIPTEVPIKKLDDKLRVYFSKRVNSSNLLNLYENINDYVVLNRNCIEFIKDLKGLNDYLDELKTRCPMSREMMLYDIQVLCVKWQQYVKRNVLVCDENISGSIVEFYIKPLVFSDIISYEAPEISSSITLNFGISKEFIPDPYLPCVCYRDAKKDAYLLWPTPSGVKFEFN